MKPSAAEILRSLRAVEDGSVTLRCADERTPQETYAGDVRYVAANGWTIVVFNDCNEWDYLDAGDAVVSYARGARCHRADRDLA